MDALLLALVLFAIVALPMFWPSLNRYRRKLKKRWLQARQYSREE
jgi:DMSO/TMAO reductase YedYZ heme-binding membrane subunit